MASVLALLLLLVSPTLSATLSGSPRLLSILEEKVKPWSGDVQNVPDGKMFMIRKSLSQKDAGYIINTTPNNLISSTSSSILDITGPYNDPSLATQDSYQNILAIANDIPIPPAKETGLRGNGSLYDGGSLWIFNAFRLSSTSSPNTSSDALIGFEHNEDYWHDVDPASDCTCKSIGVRYSHDLGKSWTRSIPIITKDRQNATCNPDNRFTGTGDFATAWIPQRREWIIVAQEGPLVMSRSSDPLARPGTWERMNPVSNITAPGFVGLANGTVLFHPDLYSIHGSNPSIIFDSKNAVWHMVYAKWGGGIAYTKSSDLYRWEKPYLIWEAGEQMAPNATYPTLVGDEGDALSTDGKATLLFTAANKVEWGRPLWEVDVVF